MCGGKLNLGAEVGVAKCEQHVQQCQNTDGNVGVWTQIGPLSLALACPGNPSLPLTTLMPIYIK